MKLNGLKIDGLDLKTISIQYLAGLVLTDMKPILDQLSSADDLISEDLCAEISRSTVLAMEGCGIVDAKEIMHQEQLEYLSGLSFQVTACLLNLKKDMIKFLGSRILSIATFDELVVSYPNDELKSYHVAFFLVLVSVMNAVLKELFERDDVRFPEQKKEMRKLLKSYEKKIDEDQRSDLELQKCLLHFLSMVNNNSDFLGSALILSIDSTSCLVKYDQAYASTSQPFLWVPGFAMNANSIRGVFFIEPAKTNKGSLLPFGKCSYHPNKTGSFDYVCTWIIENENISTGSNDSLGDKHSEEEKEKVGSAEGSQNDDPNPQESGNEKIKEDLKREDQHDSAPEQGDGDGKIPEAAGDNQASTDSSNLHHGDDTDKRNSSLQATLIQQTNIDPQDDVSVVPSENANQSTSSTVGRGVFFMDPHDNRLRYKSAANPAEFQSLGSSNYVAELKFLNSLRGCESSIKIPAGLTIICGRSSVGKSTFLRAIMDQISSVEKIVGFLEPDEMSLSDGADLENKLNELILESDVIAIDSARYFMYGGRSSALPGAINGAFFNMIAELSSNLARDKKAMLMVVNPLTGDRETELLSKIVESIKGSATAMLMVDINFSFSFESRYKNKRREILEGRTTDILSGSTEFKDLVDEANVTKQSVLSNWEEEPQIMRRDTVHLFDDQYEKETF